MAKKWMISGGTDKRIPLRVIYSMWCLFTKSKCFSGLDYKNTVLDSQNLQVQQFKRFHKYKSFKTSNHFYYS